MEQQVKIIYFTDNMKIYYNKTTKEVKMYSENKIKYDTNKLAMITINDIDWDKMNFNYEIKVVNGKLNFTQKEKSQIEKKKELETQLDQSSNLDEVKTIIRDLINL